MKEVFCSKQCAAKHTDPRDKHRRRARLPLGSYAALLFALTITALLMPLGFYSPAGAQSGKLRYQQDIEQVFSNHEDIKLDTHAVSRGVRESGHLSLRTAAHDFEIELRPNDLRSPRYTAQE